jgi:hypothetical protein
MAAPAMPTAVHLGPYTYRLTDTAEDWATLDRAERDDCYGYTLHTSAVIYIQPDIEPVMKRVIVVHEILHAAAFASGNLGDGRRAEEAWVAMAAGPLVDALRRTVGLMEWLAA